MEANREAAADALDKAKAKKEAGDFASAIRLTEKSIKLSPSDKAHAFLEFLKKFGPDSDCAKGVARILQAADHYAVLELSSGADDKSIKRAYQQLALKVHPDKNAAEGAQAAFQKLSEAFSTLSQPAAKQEYDAKLRFGPQRSASAAGPRPAPAGWQYSRPQPPPQYRSAGWQGPPRAAAAGAGAAPDSGVGSKVELLREIAQLRHELSDAREQKAVLPILRAQLKQRTDDLEREKTGRQRDQSQWQELQRSWHERHVEAERRLRESAELEAQLRRVARLDKGELENLRVRHDALLKRQVSLEAELEAGRAATDVLRGVIASAGGQMPAEVCRMDGASGCAAAEQGERRSGQPWESADGTARRAMPALGRSTLAIQPRRPPQGTAWRLQLTPCVADGRVPVHLTFSSGTRSAVMMGRAHGGRDQFGLSDPRISRNHVRISAGDGLASAGDRVVAIATAVGANAIGVRRSAQTSLDDGSIEIAAKGEAVELRDGDQLLLLAEEAHGMRFEYFVSLRPVTSTIASVAEGSTEPPARPGASSEHGTSTITMAQSAEFATSPGVCGGDGQAHSDSRIPDAGDVAPGDHATSHQDRAGAAADGPSSAHHTHGEAVHAHKGLPEGTDETQSDTRDSATLGDAEWSGSPAPKRMRVGQPHVPVIGPLSGASVGATLDDPIEL